MLFNAKLKKKLQEVLLEKEELLFLVNSLKKNMPTIEFTPDGTIVDANELFLSAVGFDLSEIVGQHHRIFLR